MPTEWIGSPVSLTYSPNKLRFIEVDGLRAVACIFVIVFHTSAVLGSVASHGSRLLDGVRGVGMLGVFMFFAISGYVIPCSLRGERVLGCKRFAIRRFWRLWPPFGVSLFALYIGDVSKYTGSQLILGVTMFPSLFGVKVIGYFWTLEIELLFYVIVAAAFLVFRRLNPSVTIMLFLLALVWCWSWSKPPCEGGYWVRSANCLTIMFFGACCRIFMELKAGWRFGRWLVSPRSVSIGLVSGLVSIWPVQGAYFSFLSGDLYHVKAAVVMLASIFGFLFWVVLTPVRVRWLARIGRWTYSTYLFHGVVLYSFLEKFKRELAGWPLPICILGALILSFALGGFLYRYLEQPSDRIGRRLSDEGQPTTR